MSGSGASRTGAVLFAILLMTSVMAGTVAFSGDAAAAPGDVVYRVNAGATSVDAIDGGPDWVAGAGSTYVDGGSTYSTGATVSADESVPASTPTSVFSTELYGNQTWTFSDEIEAGQRYEVRLYFAEIYHGVNNPGSVGARVFDVNVEGGAVELDDYDPYADVGPATGTMKTVTVTPDDGEITVDLTTEVDNAKISAIEIVEATPQPNTLGGPSSADLGSTVVGESATETVTVTNLGADGDDEITITGVSTSGSESFAAGTPSQETLAPGESAEIPVTFEPETASAVAGTLSVSHSGNNTPLTVDLSAEGTSTAQVGFGKSDLQGFDQGQLTALEWGPDGRLYVAKQNGMVYALTVERAGDNDYEVVSQESIDAIQSIPNHDDDGTYVPGETTRQVTGLTVGGTADEPVVYVSSSDPTIDVGTDDDDTDTNSGAISRLTFDWNADGSLASVDHTVLVLGLPRSEENHATNGLDLSADGETLFAAQGGHTNKGAPSNNFGYTPEYALSAAILSIDLAQIEANYAPKNLQNYDSAYPDVEFLYAIPTIQTDDATDGDDLPFGGNDGVNQAKWIADGPVQVFASGYRNPYDLVNADGDIYVVDNGPNGGWGGVPVGEGPGGACTNEPNDPGPGTGDQLHLATEGSYAGHPTPIRGNPTGADIYDANGNLVLDINESNSPVPASEVNPAECDYQSPSEDTSLSGFSGWTAGVDEYTASNFDGAMQGDLLVVVNANSVTRVQLDADGEAVTDTESAFFSDIVALGVDTQGDDGPFPGTVWTARAGITVFEPNDYDTNDSDGDDGSGDGPTCTGADDPSLDEDGDGYDNADELDAGTDPCSAASTPADFDGDGTSNLNDPDDDNDGTPDTSDPFAVDPDDGTTTTLPIEMDLTETALFGESGQGWTGLMTTGDTDYAARYDPDQMTVGGAAQVLTVEDVPTGDAINNDQQFAFQRGFVPSDGPFTIETTVNGLPSDPANYQSVGVYVGTGTQNDYLKLVASAKGGAGGVQFAKETDGTFQDIAHPTAPGVTGPGNDTTLSMTVYPSNDTVHAYYTPDGGERTFVGSTTIPAAWLDTSDGTAPAVGVIATSYQAGSTFDATWTDLSVTPLDTDDEPANAPPVADAGADQTVTAGETVTLDASASTDSDGDDPPLGYTWTQTAGTPDGLLDLSDAAEVSFVAPDVDTETTLTFQVSVSDGTNASTDTVNITVEPAADDPPGDDTNTSSVAAAIAASGGANDSLIEDGEIQTAINLWATDGTVPGTDNATIDDATIQTLINLWATETAVDSAPDDGSDGDGSDGSDGDGGDGDGSDGDPDDGNDTTNATASVLVEVTPDSGVDASTYGAGSYQVTNTGEVNVTSVSIDLSTATLPDVVFDPEGTAGDSTGGGFMIGDDGGTGITTTPGSGDAFAAPHNGVDGADGYDTMTVSFDDFQPGETAAFSADNDPTSIKGATVASQVAGPISGLEVAGATVTVTYEDGTTQTTQLVGDGSAGGSAAVVTDEEAPAPTLGVENVSLDDAILDDRHAGAVVTDAEQTVTVTGEPGEQVTLVRVEGALALSNVPEPYNDVEAFEANTAVDVEYVTATLDDNGEATIPITLTNSTAAGGLNYLVAVHGDVSGDTGLASNVVVLDLEESADDGNATPQVLHRVNAGSQTTVSATDDGPDWTGVADTSSPYLVSVAETSAGTYCGGPDVTVGDDVPASTPAAVFDCERYGNSSWTFPVDAGQTVEVRLYFANTFSGASEPGDRQFNVSVEGTTALTNYDPVATAGHATGTVETVTVTDDGDGTITVAFTQGAAENPEIRAIELVAVEDDDA